MTTFAYNKSFLRSTHVKDEHSSSIVFGDWYNMPQVPRKYVFRCPSRKCFPLKGHENQTYSYPEKGFASNQEVEVVHTFFDPPNTGFWFYFAVGSGVYLNLSRTIAFRTHEHALQTWKDAKYYRHLSTEAKIVNVARHLEYDTVQFTRFNEHRMIKHEIVMTGINTGHPRLFSPCQNHAHMFRKITSSGDCASIDGSITSQCRQCKKKKFESNSRRMHERIRTVVFANDTTAGVGLVE
jgi:hypothetical protein